MPAPFDSKVFNEEPFEPVAAICPYDRIKDAIDEANHLPYGLVGYAFTRSLKNANLLTRKVEAGILWINMSLIASAEMPFGGIKDSGFGTEGDRRRWRPTSTFERS